MTLVLKSPDNNLVRLHKLGICRRCRHYHRIEAGFTPDEFGAAVFNWYHKHRECWLNNPDDVEVISPSRFIPKGFDDRIFNLTGEGPQWLDWKENADVKLSYVADAAITMDLSALASSSSWTGGRESTAIVNSSNYLDYFVSGSFISGTTPTAPAEARLYYVRAIEDTPTWPDVFDGTDSAETVTNTNILDAMLLAWSGTASASSNITYPIQKALTLAQAFGICPKNWLVFFTHAHTAALKTDALNTNSLFHQAVFATVT